MANTIEIQGTPYYYVTASYEQSVDPNPDTFEVELERKYGIAAGATVVFKRDGVAVFKGIVRKRPLSFGLQSYEKEVISGFDTLIKLADLITQRELFETEPSDIARALLQPCAIQQWKDDKFDTGKWVFDAGTGAGSQSSDNDVLTLTNTGGSGTYVFSKRTALAIYPGQAQFFLVRLYGGADAKYKIRFICSDGSQYDAESSWPSTPGSWTVKLYDLSNAVLVSGEGSILGKTIIEIKVYAYKDVAGSVSNYFDYLIFSSSIQSGQSPLDEAKWAGSASVNSSDAYKTFDRDFNTWWSTSPANQTNGQWLKIDLSKLQKICRVVVRHTPDKFVRNYKIETSPDNSVWTERAAKTNNPCKIIDETFSFDGVGVECRYVRITCTVDYAIDWDIEEIYVYGPDGSSGLQPATADWYGLGWKYRKKITIDKTKVQGSLVDFPVLVYRSSDADLASKAQSDGDDILFTKDDGVTKLDHEIERFESATGKLFAWVRIPTLSSSADTVIYMYYGNPAASNQQNPTGVWDTNFKLVYHMKDDPDNSHVKDSTINANNGTKTGADQPPEADAKIGKGQDFDGVSGHVITSNTYTVVPGAFTAKAWFKREGDSGGSSSNAWHAICNRINGRHNVSLSVKKDGTQVKLQIYRTDGGYSYAYCTIPTPNDYHMVAGAYDGVDKIYAVCDDVWSAPVTLPYPPATGTSQVIIGRDGLNWNYANGPIDESRISAAFRGVDWLKTCYNNENDPAAFITVGVEDVGEFPDYGSSIKVPFHYENRLNAFAKVVKIIGWEFWVDANDKVHFKQQRGQTRSITFTVGTNVEMTSRDIDDKIANWIVLLGRGEGVNQLVVVRKDQASIDAYGKRMLPVPEKDMIDAAAMIKRADEVLAAMKDPIEAIGLNVLDTGSGLTFETGDTVTITDPHTGLSGSYRLLSVGRRWSA